MQGLRALAVLAVVGDHLVGRPVGGFLGVDIFFVISGFLITGLLLREHQQSGRIDLLEFYRRRIKRTVPVALLVLAATLAVGSLVLSVYGFEQLVPAASAAGTFWSNWHLVALGTDYLHATDAPSAVQHYWSLSVEEQFYVLWPAMLIGLLVLQRRTSLRWVAPAAVGLIAAASVIWAAVETEAHPTAAYFSTFTRGWELLAGAALAFARPLIERLPSVVRPWLAWVGLATLVGGLLSIGPDSAFPYPWALVAVVGTAAVIAAGTGGETQVWPLTNGLSQYLGKISYSIYLWHFPVIVFVNLLHPQAGLRVHLLEIALTVLLSMLSYRFVEEPFRHASWRRPRFALPRRRVIAAAAFSTAGVVLLSGGAVASRSTPQVVSVSTDGYFNTETSPASTARSAAIRAALQATAWPVLTPSDQELGDGARVVEWTRDGCLNAFGPAETAERCVFGNKAAARTAVLYGDSVALSYLPALREALGQSSWRIEVLTNGQCPAIDISVLLGDGSSYPDCDAYHRFALDRIAAERPTLVVMSSSYLTLDRLASGRRDAEGAAEWTARTRATVEEVSRVAQHVVVLDAPPIEASPQWCKTGISSPQECITGVAENWRRIADAQHAGVESAGAGNVAYPSTLPWFCSQDGRCPSFVNGVVTLADGMHLTTAGSRQLAPLFREALTQPSR